MVFFIFSAPIGVSTGNKQIPPDLVLYCKPLEEVSNLPLPLLWDVDVRLAEDGDWANATKKSL